MKYLLDTCTLSYFVQGDPRVVARLKATSPALLAVSSVSVMEIEYGLLLSAKRAKSLGPVMKALFSSVEIAAYGLEDANATASIRASLKKKGRPIGPFDLMIAGTALSRGFTLVTSNVREFNNVSGLTIEDWRGSR